MKQEMNYIKKELNKLLPYAVLYGALGGILLIIVNNVMGASVLGIALTYVATIGLGVFLLNSKRHRRDTKSSILYGYLIYAIMTVISYVDTIFNTNQTFYNPLFEKIWMFVLITGGVLFLSAAIAVLYKKKAIS